MLNLIGQKFQLFDGFTRRSLLRVGALSFGGLTLPSLLRQRAMARAAGREMKDTSVILIWQAGGPSHIDMYDLKPQAPAEFRGEFQPIATNVPGIDVSEHLPLSARQMDKFSILRSVTHPDPGDRRWPMLLNDLVALFEAMRLPPADGPSRMLIPVTFGPPLPPP